MRQSSAALSAAVLATWASALSAQPFGEQIDVNVVNVEVYVTGKDGQPVTGLERGDFTLSEDGRPVPITNFEAVDPPAAVRSAAPGAAGGTAPEDSPAVEGAADPLHLAVFIDNTQVTVSHRSRVLRQLRDLLTRRLAPGDLVLLATFDPGLHVRLPFTADRSALAEALDALQKVSADNGEDARARRFAWQQILEIQELARLQLSMESRTGSKVGLIRSRREEAGDQPEGRNRNGSDGAGPCPAGIADPVKVYAQEARQRIMGSISGLNALARSLSGLSGRKALLHISDGISVTPGEDLFRGLGAMCADAQGLLDYHGSRAMLDAQTYSTAKAWSDLAARASAQRVTFYTLQASGLEGSSAASAEFDHKERLFQSPEIDRSSAKTAAARSSRSPTAPAAGRSWIPTTSRRTSRASRTTSATTTRSATPRPTTATGASTPSRSRSVARGRASATARSTATWRPWSGWSTAPFPVSSRATRTIPSRSSWRSATVLPPAAGSGPCPYGSASPCPGWAWRRGRRASTASSAFW